jgi:hypothetical protein
MCAVKSKTPADAELSATLSKGAAMAFSFFVCEKCCRLRVFLSFSHLAPKEDEESRPSQTTQKALALASDLFTRDDSEKIKSASE